MGIGALVVPVSAEIGGLQKGLKAAAREVKGFHKDIGRSISLLTDASNISGLVGSMVGGPLGGIVGTAMGEIVEKSGLWAQVKETLIGGAFVAKDIITGKGLLGDGPELSKEEMIKESEERAERIKQHGKDVNAAFEERTQLIIKATLGEDELLQRQRELAHWSQAEVEFGREKDRQVREAVQNAERLRKEVELYNKLAQEAHRAGLNPMEQEIWDLRMRGLNANAVPAARGMLQDIERAQMDRRQADFAAQVRIHEIMENIPGGGDIRKMFGDQDPTRNAMAQRIADALGEENGPVGAMMKGGRDEFQNTQRLRRAIEEMDKPDPTPEEIRKAAKAQADRDAKRERLLEKIKEELREMQIKQVNF